VTILGKVLQHTVTGGVDFSTYETVDTAKENLFKLILFEGEVFQHNVTGVVDFSTLGTVDIAKKNVTS